MARMYGIGIDFGTSNSCVCVAPYFIGRDGRMAPAPLLPPAPLSVQHADTIPSALYLGSGREANSFGARAEEKYAFYPERVLTHFKLGLGEAGEAGAQAYACTLAFFQFLRDRLAESLPLDGREEDVEFATNVGHPVQWSAEQRRLTMRAAIEAGLPNVAIEDETSAVLYGHLCDETMGVPADRDARLLVIDMGAGTTDFAFVDLPADRTAAPVTMPVDVSKIAGSWNGSQSTYGGKDIDLLLLRHFMGSLEVGERSRYFPFLLREMRRFKEQFSRAVAGGHTEYSTRWVIADRARDLSLSIGEFEALTHDYTAHLPRILQHALSLARLKGKDIDAVVLTGGNSQWYWVEASIQQVFPHLSSAAGTLIRHSHPEQSVARGLAYRWTIEALGGRPRPRRRATHGVWVASVSPPLPNGSRPRPALPAGTGPQHQLDRETLVPLLDRGALLPFQTRQPVSVAVEKADFNSSQATLRFKLYSGSSEHSRQELMEQVASFERPLWERMVKAVTRYVPWSTPFDRDNFDMKVRCKVDENELFSSEITVTRVVHGRPAGKVVHVVEVAP